MYLKRCSFSSEACKKLRTYEENETKKAQRLSDLTSVQFQLMCNSIYDSVSLSLPVIENADSLRDHRLTTTPRLMSNNKKYATATEASVRVYK